MAASDVYLRGLGEPGSGVYPARGPAFTMTVAQSKWEERRSGLAAAAPMPNGSLLLTFTEKRPSSRHDQKTAAMTQSAFHSKTSSWEQPCVCNGSLKANCFASSRLAAINI